MTSTPNLGTAGIPRQPIRDAPYDVVTAYAPVDMDGHRDLAEYGRRCVAAALKEAGTELGAYDQRIADWLGGFDAVTAVTVASWLLRAHDAGTGEGNR